jgi:histidine triad (HIT) family protein
MLTIGGKHLIRLSSTRAFVAAAHGSRAAMNSDEVGLAAGSLRPILVLVRNSTYHSQVQKAQAAAESRVSGDTIFSKILRKEIPSTPVYEDEMVYAFRDIQPQAPAHIVLIPRKPIPQLSKVYRLLGYPVRELKLKLGVLTLRPWGPPHPTAPGAARQAGDEDEALLGYLLNTARKIAAQEQLDQTGYRIVINDGANGAQSVYHLHLHIMCVHNAPNAPTPRHAMPGHL